METYYQKVEINTEFFDFKGFGVYIWRQNLNLFFNFKKQKIMRKISINNDINVIHESVALHDPENCLFSFG
jgi:hypothetical protein